MGVPQYKWPRLYYQAGRQRFEDARFLLSEGKRTTGAVYLAGYSVECALKALLLSSLPERQHHNWVEAFQSRPQRRKMGIENFSPHSFEDIKAMYRRRGGASFPAKLAPAFARVNTWQTNLRYASGGMKYGDAEQFLKAALQIIEWADTRH